MESTIVTIFRDHGANRFPPRMGSLTGAACTEKQVHVRSRPP